ncbi:MAG: gsiC 8, partial [Ilumatobacteraceae bacterium]|nr:gsiC 8 [Ilumatobacteraceae bacterium]
GLMRYFLQRLLQFAIVFFLVTFGVLVFMRIGLNAPGDPARTMLGGVASESQIQFVTKRYHLDANYLVQYWYWLKGMFTLDFGTSTKNLAVTTFIRPRILPTVFLGLYATFFALVIAVPMAVSQAYRRDSVGDKVGSFFSFAFVSIPALVLAPLLKYVFIDSLAWFPRLASPIYPWDSLTGHFKNFFVPTLALTLPLSAIFVRLLRADMVSTLQADFVTLASAKGVSPRRVLWGHALRNSLFTLLTNVGVQVGGLVGGALVVESYFNVKGMGSLLVNAILGSDLFTVQSVSAILVATVVVVNLLVDMSYALIDPRIRHARALS